MYFVFGKRHDIQFFPSRQQLTNRSTQFVLEFKDFESVSVGKTSCLNELLNDRNSVPEDRWGRVGEELLGYIVPKLLIRLDKLSAWDGSQVPR
jgi:hypothetical protein